ncbi:MAG: GNAT family N-acetyltransferase, partial [Planctomycetota bacterium]
VVVARGDRLFAVMMSTRWPEETGPNVRHLRIMVHPDHRGEGWARTLLRFAERQDTPPTTTLETNIMGRWIAGEQFAVEEGFKPIRKDLFLAREGPVPEALEPPPGFTIRPDRGPEDDEAWARLNHDGYAHKSAYTPLTDEDLKQHRATPGFTLVFAESDGVPCGLCHVMDWQDEGPYINSVVVSNAMRGRGLARPLTVAGIRAALGEDGGKIHLNVYADNESAVHVYESLGFKRTSEATTWRKVRSASPAWHRT